MEHFGLTQTVAPTEEPVSLTEARAYCRVDSGDTTQDTLLNLLIQAARRRCEQVTRRALVTQTWRLTLDRFPGLVFVSPDYPGWEYLRLGSDGDPRVLRLPRPPLVSVSSLTYVDTTGATQTWSAANYQVDTDSEPGRVFPAYGTYWPEVRAQANAVVLTYVAGYGNAAAQPAEIKLRLLQHVAHCFEKREDSDEAYLDRLFEAFAIGNWW